jgi:ankyrin repeat protein
MTAARQGDIGIVQELLDHGAKPDFRVADADILPETPLLLAAEQGHTQVMRLLLKRGADPNAKVGLNPAPLTEVIGKGQWEAVRVLVEAGIDVNAGENTGRPALMSVAGMIDGDDTFSLLLAKGAHVNGKSLDGFTPLMTTAVTGYLEHFQRLLKAGADIKVQDIDDQTILMWAVLSDKVEMVRAVLPLVKGTNVDVNARNKMGKTALSRALDRNQAEIVSILKEAGAKE